MIPTRGQNEDRASGSIADAVHGLWRSLVAHLTGGQGVAGSNPVSPTITGVAPAITTDRALREERAAGQPGR